MYYQNLPYRILCDGKVIARFLYQSDRDVALDSLREQHDDSAFTADTARDLDARSGRKE